MVVLAVAAILLGLAVPAFSRIIASNRLVGQANELVSALQFTRSEAVRRRARGIVCRSTNQTTCSSGTTWTAWIAGLDTDRDGAIDEVIRVGEVRLPLQVRASTNAAADTITFRPDGYAHMANGSLLDAALSVCLPVSAPSENVRAVTVSAGSRISTKVLSTAGVCAVPANIP